jgi:hypothetical protein
MTTKPRRPLGEPRTRVEVSEKLVSLRHQTLALSAFIDLDGPLPTDLVDAESISGSTTFEEITCVGLTPSMDQLTAVVRIHAGSGYSGPLCAAGSTEHVRFFVSTDDGATWTDAGTDSFAVHDTTGPRPLDHAVNVVAPMRHTLCWIENHPLVRAILSWNVAPPAGNPNWSPPWGNVVDVRVRPRSRRFPKLFDLIEVGAIKIPKNLAATLVLDSPITFTPAPSPAVAELAKTYADAKVPAHRFALPAFLAATQSGLQAPAVTTVTDAKSAGAKTVGGAFGAVLTEIDLSSKDFLLGLFKTDGDTSYEELGCIGYDPVEDALVGVFTVKRPSGYSGGPCTAGSTEHVAFWVDWGSGWEYVGTTATTVHDEDVPDDGLHFAVYHPLASYAHRRACSDGPVQPRVRAILSWQQAPPPGDPNWRPTWGNREETTFELPAGAVTPLSPVLESVSGYAACQIDAATGRTIVHQRPFGGGISIAGFIPGAPDRSSPPMKYRLVARQIGSGGAVIATETLSTSFSVWVTESVGGSAPTQYPVTQVADADGWFDYLHDPDPSGTGWRQVVGNRLYSWQSIPRTGLWEIELRAKDAGGTEYAAQVITCPDTTTRQQVRLHLDQAEPVVNAEITSYRMPGQPAIPAGSCMKFPVGAILAGTFSATDEHFDSIGLAIEGAAYSVNAPGGVPRWTLTGATAYPAASTNGTSGTWEFNTAGMPACGYVLRATAVDRTVNGSGGWRDVDVEGFSLE